LRECDKCGLRFRLPKENPEEAAIFYQSQYRSGFTTDCPSDEELEELLAKGFRGSPKDYISRIQLLKAAGLRPGDSILNFGCSWGYGSWQLAEAGFNVYSYEVSRPRAHYAHEKLRCHMVNDLSEIRGEIKCFFSAHVIEHLPDPNLFWQAVEQVLKANGMLVCFTPNGDPIRETTKGYHRIWGRVHPLLLTQRALKEMAMQYGFIPYVFSSPYSIERIRHLTEDRRVSGSELALIAFRNSNSENCNE
jgi:2-polyprenyl-3-methyl-5-hydroxy-6-metoxy-1,4-benzoquinol methylase